MTFMALVDCSDILQSQSLFDYVSRVLDQKPKATAKASIPPNLAITKQVRLSSWPGQYCTASKSDNA